MAVAIGIVGLLSASCVEAATEGDWLLPDDWQAVETLGATVAMPAELEVRGTANGCTSYGLDPGPDLCDPATWTETSIGVAVLEGPPGVTVPAELPRTARWQPFAAPEVEPDDLGRGAAVAGFNLPARYTRPPSVTVEIIDTTSETSGAPLRQLIGSDASTLAIVGICAADAEAGFCAPARQLVEEGAPIGSCRYHRRSTNIDCRLADDVGIRIFQGLVHTSDLERLREAI